MQVETALVDSSFLPIVLDFRDVLKKINDDEFENFCRHNPDVEIELTKEGELIIMPPTGGRTGIRNFSLIGYFFNWLEKDKSGVGFDSSTVFKLPNGAKRSPDLAWITNERWEKLTNVEQEKFPPLCPDFVVELRSPSDSLVNLQNKMEEYIENGAVLGWLIDPLEKKVHVYRPDAEIEVLDNPKQVSGEPLLKEFALNVKKLW
ncbi:MAG: Uma2 family endonuclease [Acidobacteria bacterium]|jgi:Uma2 family endonuclease|nr:Uma2 family endonuclease [Acidobacteriota bacterium]